MQRPLLFLLACSLVAALPLRLPILENQKPLLLSGSHHAAHPLTQHLDRMPISAELLFTASDDDEMIHVWLPLGKRISTRDYPVLPLHPTSARVANVLGSSSKTSVRRKHQQVTCMITARADRLRLDAQANLKAVFQEADGVVRLNEANSPLYLEGREVESYECF